MARLRRRLGVAETTSLALGAMIGAGVYVSMGEAAGNTGASLLLAVLVGAGVALLNGLSSVELAVHDPQAGGAYLFASRLVSPAVGFIAGWIFLFAGLTAGATFALTFAAYLGPLFPGVPPKAIGLALILAAGLLNIVGVQPSIRANIVLVIVNVTVLVIFVLLTLPGVGSDVYRPADRDLGTLPPSACNGSGQEPSCLVCPHCARYADST